MKSLKKQDSALLRAQTFSSGLFCLGGGILCQADSWPWPWKCLSFGHGATAGVAVLMVYGLGQLRFPITLSPVLIRLPKIPACEHVHECPPPHCVVLHKVGLALKGNLDTSFTGLTSL